MLTERLQFRVRPEKSTDHPQQEQRTSFLLRTAQLDQEEELQAEAEISVLHTRQQEIIQLQLRENHIYSAHIQQLLLLHPGQQYLYRQIVLAEIC